MRERIVCGPQTMSMPGPDTLEPASGPATNGDGQLLPPGQSEEAPVATGITPYPSPLSTYLTRSELVPFVLELEKSLLVSREHDYAKAPDRLAVLQATALLERSSDGAITHNSGRGVEAKTESSRAEQCEELLNCCGELGRLRRSALLCSGENATSRHLRAVVGLQASLIREQQEQIYTKDRELASIRRDRDQLEARLERMERRLAVHQKRNTVTTPSFHDSESTPTSGLLSVPRRHSRAESLIMSERHVRSRSASLERTRNRLRHQQTSNTTSATPVSQDERKSARKRLRIEDNRTTPEPTPVKRVRKPPKLMEMRTSVEYAGLGLLPVQDGLAPRLTANHRDLQAENTDTLLNDKLCTASNTLSNSRLSSDNPIVVPLWEFRPLKPLVELKEEPTATEPEDISEDMFLRRHKKHEEDEKRRKRWDLQRTRSLLEHQELLKKYNKKSGMAEPTEERNDRITSLIPKLEDIEEIEILPTVTVSAFGHPLPLLKRSEFELPWFDLATREARENVRTTRSKARTSTTSAGSSDDV